MSGYREYIKSRQKQTAGFGGRRRRKWLLWLGLLAAAAAIWLGRGSIRSLLDRAAGTGTAAETMKSWVDGAMEQLKSQKNAAAGDRRLPIYAVERSDHRIAISFDAAWGAEDFDRIMEVLEAHQVKTTFFMTGGWVEQNPDCVKTLVEKGHDLGNHSVHHYDMTSLSREEITAELNGVREQVKELTGYEMELFRPPYGAYNNLLIDTAYEENYYPIQWSVDSLDWKNYGKQSIIDTVCSHKALKPGAIILCHNGAKYTAEALDELLTNLEDQGYELVPISELIERDNYHMDPSGQQIKD